jgi:hypothetical protein
VQQWKTLTLLAMSQKHRQFFCSIILGKDDNKERRYKKMQKLKASSETASTPFCFVLPEENDARAQQPASV